VGPGGELLSGISFAQRYQFLRGVWVEGSRVGPLGGGRKGGPGFGTGQERLGPSFSGHGILKARGLKNHAQTASGSSASLIVCGPNFPGKVWRKREWTWIGCQSQTASGLEY
jgi:hypothetical protein